MNNSYDRELGWDDEINNEGGDYTPLPEGDYDFTVKKVERLRTNGSEKLPPCKMAMVTFSIWSTEGEREVTDNFVLHSKLEWKLSALFLSVGMKKHGEPLRMNWTGIVGQSGTCKIVQRTFKKKDGGEGVTNDIKKFYAYDENVETVSPSPNTPTQQYSQPVQNTATVQHSWNPGQF